MKNLRIYRSKNVDFKANVVGHCIDADNGNLFVLTKDFVLFKTQTYGNNVEAERVNNDFNHKSYGIEIIERDDVRLIEFLVETGSIMIALKSGHIIRIGVSSFSLPSESLYKHDKIISSVRLSPDQDLMALADEESNVHIMSIHGEIIHTSNALTQNESLHKPVGVGWGSKETQFFGLDGRPSAEKQLKDKITLSNEELATINQIESSTKFNEFRQRQERSTVIDWRGDGQFIGTMTFLVDSNKHCLKIWNRNLELQYMSEHLVTVERGLLSWVPNGQYICCAQRRDQRINDIAMFEKNGMVHQRITLPITMKDVYIKDLTWSPDSKILAIIVNQFVILDDQVHNKPILMLYTMQNFYYYLKFSSNLINDCDYLLRWDPISQNRLHTISSNGHYGVYDCCFEVTYSGQYSTVAVVDANKVLITPMELCNIPPPMSAIVLETNSQIYKIAINPCSAGNIFILTLDNRLIYTISSVEASSIVQEDTAFKLHLENHVAGKLSDKLKSYKVINFDDAQSFQHLTPINELCLVATRLVQNDCQIVLINLPKLEEGNSVVQSVLSTIKNKQVICVSRDSMEDSPNFLTIVLDDRSSLLLNLSTGETKPLFELHSTVAGSRFSHNFIDIQTTKSSSATVLISLGQDLSLRFNADIIASNSCTSFRVTENYLIYTTTDNNMHFILLTHLWSKKTSGNVESWSQPIENGGTLIIACESDAKVVLQMPRGNLEILHPRVLVFSTLTNLLDKRDYVEAIKLARRHRLNMNFLSDYLLRLLINSEDLNKFANDVACHDPSLLSLFITELENNDTITGRYECIMKHLPDRQVDLKKKFQHLRSDKVNQICTIIKLPENENFLQPRLLCLLKTTPRSTGDALRIVHKLGAEHQTGALKFMLYFIDIDQLFLEALCTYDTDITLMVASASNKDPKEYLALLDDFNKEENSKLRCFKIDMHVKRYEEAFRHLLDYLIETDNDDTRQLTRTQLITLVISKRLYRHALSLLNARSDQKNLMEVIWVKYAEYLLEKRHYTEAGLAYSKALDLEASEEYFNEALKCFSLVNNWEKSIIVVAKSGVNEQLKQESLKKISKQLMEHGKFYEAIVISRQPTQVDISNESISELVNQGGWYLADFLARGDFRKSVRTEIEASVLELANAQLISWTNGLDTAKEHYDRVKELITTYHTRKYNDIESENCFVSDSLSTVDGSEISSTISGSDGRRIARSGASSIKTRNSSKSNKSQNSKKKRINLKTGSRHEDIALVCELKNFMSKQKQSQHEAMVLSAALFEYCNFELAKDTTKSINQLLSESLTFSIETSELLWPTGPQNEQKYSLYRRFGDTLLCPDDTFENIDFEVLIRPDLPKDLLCFEI